MLEVNDGRQIQRYRYNEVYFKSTLAVFWLIKVNCT